VIILEDMCAQGYQLGRLPPEDYEKSKLIVQKLAKFHAATYYLANEKVCLNPRNFMMVHHTK
jgi:hypothetical protein